MNNNNNIKQGVTYGIIGGLIFLAISFGPWALGSVGDFVKVTTITNFIPFHFIILLVIGFKLRKDNGGLYSFKEALQFTFVAYVIYALIEAVGTYVLYVLLDPALTAKVLDISIANATQWFEKLGMPEEEIEKTIKKMQAEPKNTTFKQVFLGLGLSIGFNFLKALILSVIIKKNEELPDQI
jgi:hypothetical protein